MRFTLNLQSDNAAFTEDPGTEVARILREAADRLEAGQEDANCRDINGNTVGSFYLDTD